MAEGKELYVSGCSYKDCEEVCGLGAAGGVESEEECFIDADAGGAWWEGGIGSMVF